MPTKRRETDDFGIAPFTPGAGTPGAGSTGGGATRNEVSESTSSTGLGTNFGLTGGGLTGLRSPDRIDTPANVLNITTSVGVQSLPAEQMATLQAQLAQAGFTTESYTPTGTLDDETRKALLELKRTASATGVDDLTALRTTLETKAQVEAGILPGGDGTAGGPSRSVNKTITEPVFTDAMTARATVRDAMRARLGREPTADEYHQFRNLLSNSEAGQDVTTQVTRTDGQGNTTTRVKRSDDTTDPSPDTVADDMLRRGELGKEANTVTAASFFDIIAGKVGGM